MNTTVPNQLSYLFENDNLLESNLLNLLPMAVYTCDADGIIQKYNEASVELWGREPVAGSDMWCGSWKIFDTDGNPMDLGECPMAVTLKEGKPVTGVQIIIERPDGIRKRISPSPRPIFDTSGNLIGALNVLTDITDSWEKEKNIQESSSLLERKVNERTADLVKNNEALKKSEERYHKMVEEVQDYAILLLDKNGTVLNWNRGAERIKGYRDEEIIGKNFRVFYLDKDRKEQLPEKLIEQAVNEGRAVHEGQRVRKDGTKFWGIITITALHDDNGEVIGFSKVTRDLTEKKLAEDQIRQYTEELEYQNRELEQFAYAAAHDMREPLRKILYYNNYLVENALDGMNEKSQDYLKRSTSAATRMQHLIDDLLTYSKTSMSAGEMELVSLDNILQDTIMSQQDSIRNNEAVIDIVPLPVMHGVPVQLQQLFDNLIGNSLKYRKKDVAPFIRISHKVVKGTVNENLPESNSNYNAIEIADNGIGFEPEDAEEIFNLFHRLHTSTEYQGTGIGLAICKKIMQNHEGLITATGKTGEGAVFTLYFPVHG